MKNNSMQPAGGQKETSRVEAFSDGVFAIAITLLILELIQILHAQTGEGLQQLLLKHLNAFLAFGIGFLTILICWINHHLVFTYIKRIDDNLMWVNGFVLLVVSFTPFPTSILAEYFTKETNMALAVFCFNYFIMSIAAYCITAYVYKNRLIERDSRGLFSALKQLYKYSIIATGIIFLVCFVSVPIAIFLLCILFLVFAFPKRFSKILLRRKQKKQRAVDHNPRLLRIQRMRWYAESEGQQVG